MTVALYSRDILKHRRQRIPGSHSVGGNMLMSNHNYTNSGLADECIFHRLGLNKGAELLLAFTTYTLQERSR